MIPSEKSSKNAGSVLCTKKVYIGADVAKAKIDIYDPINKQHLTILNNNKSIAEFSNKYKNYKGEIIFICEATGGYERVFATSLTELDFTVHIAHSSKIFHFAKCKGVLAKTDKLDAKLISEFGEFANISCSNVLAKDNFELKDLMMRKVQIKEIMKTEMQRRREHLPALVQESINESIEYYKSQIKKLSKAINNILSKSEKYSAQLDLLKTMKGVGDETAQTMLILLPELGKLNKREIASLAGLAPYNNESGKGGKQRKIKGGRILVRNALYMSILSAIRFNQKIREYYLKKLDPTRTKKAMVAAMRKMLIILNSMMKNNCSFDELMER